MRAPYVGMDGELHHFGGATPFGVHFARTYEEARVFPPGQRKPLSKLPRIARAAAAYPPKRTIDGTTLTKRQFAYVKMLSAKSRIVFWLYSIFKWPARDIANTFGWHFIDQNEVYARNGAIKRALYAADIAQKNIDWVSVKEAMNEGATEEEVMEFFNISKATFRKRVGKDGGPIDA